MATNAGAGHTTAPTFYHETGPSPGRNLPPGFVDYSQYLNITPRASGEASGSDTPGSVSLDRGRNGHGHGHVDMAEGKVKEDVKLDRDRDRDASDSEDPEK